jgi:hypothetical protein
MKLAPPPSRAHRPGLSPAGWLIVFAFFSTGLLASVFWLALSGP